MEICPGCGKELIPIKCKLVCQCGYYESCSDLYPHPPINGKNLEED